MFDWWHREITLHKWMKLIDIIGWPNKMKAHTSHDLQLKAVNTSMDCLLDGKLQHFPRNEDRFQSNSEGIQDEAIVKALQCSLPQSNKSCKIAIVVSSHWVSNRHTVTASKYQGWMQNKLGWRFRIVHSGVRRGYFGVKSFTMNGRHNISACTCSCVHLKPTTDIHPIMLFLLLKTQSLSVNHPFQVRILNIGLEN